ncbi:MAG: hypothetical protein J6B89_00645 [Bacilli bacterium]|nr:hypothetical protein [Bacilli bacterium]
MSNTEILNSNIIDLKVGIDFAEIANNDDLKKYANDRISSIMSDSGINQFIPSDILVDSYVVDLVLFLKSSSIFKDNESRDYFKGKLLDLVSKFPRLNEREDIKNLI